DQIGEIGAGETGSATRNRLGIDVGGQRHLAHVHAQDLLAASHIRVRHHDLTIESAGAQQRRVEHVGSVGGSDQDNALVGLEAVHLDQQLVECLLALVVATAEAGAAVATYGIDLVDENNAGRILLGLIEHVAHAAGPHAHEHLDKIGAGNGEERYVGFAGDGPRQQGLASPRRPNEQRAARNAATEALELLRVAQELDDLLQVGLGLVDARHVLKRDAAI